MNNLENDLMIWAEDLTLPNSFYFDDQLIAIRFENIQGSMVIVRGYDYEKPDDYFYLTIEDGFEYNEFWLTLPNLEITENNIFSIIKKIVFDKVGKELVGISLENNLDDTIEKLSRCEYELIDPLMVLGRQVGFFREYDTFISNQFLTIVNDALPSNENKFNDYLALTDFIFSNQDCCLEDLVILDNDNFTTAQNELYDDHQLDLMAEINLINTGKNMIDKLYEKLNNIEDLDINLTDIEECYTKNDNIIDFIDAILELIDTGIIYYSVAIDFLVRHDPSLKYSLNLAADLGYEIKDLNSELLASLLYRDKIINEINERLEYLADDYLESKELTTV